MRRINHIAATTADTHTPTEAGVAIEREIVGIVTELYNAVVLLDRRLESLRDEVTAVTASKSRAAHPQDIPGQLTLAEVLK